MKKRLLISLGMAAMFLATGCSNQPNLENAQDVNQTAAKQAVTKTNEQNATNTAANAQESVNTDNANVQEESIASPENKQKFAKNLAEVVVYFDFDKYNIKANEWPKVKKLADLIKNNPANYTVRIEGNCDEWGTEEYNYALGLKRANTLKDALIKLGVDPKKLTIISYGELNPVCTEHTKACWSKNRRDNFTYLP
jgi:peptidoglycan-associated lipoprotein